MAEIKLGFDLQNERDDVLIDEGSYRAKIAKVKTSEKEGKVTLIVELKVLDGDFDGLTHAEFFRLDNDYSRKALANLFFAAHPDRIDEGSILKFDTDELEGRVVVMTMKHGPYSSTDERIVARVAIKGFSEDTGKDGKKATSKKTTKKTAPDDDDEEDEDEAPAAKPKKKRKPAKPEPEDDEDEDEDEEEDVIGEDEEEEEEEPAPKKKTATKGKGKSKARAAAKAEVEDEDEEEF